VFKWIRKSTLDPLAVSMSGVKLADRLLVIGCSDPSLIAALGAKVGLTGRACAVDQDPSLVASAAQISEREGVLIESAPAPGLKVPFLDESFDVVVVRDTGSSTATAPGSPAFAEAWRVLRPGGYCVHVMPTHSWRLWTTLSSYPDAIAWLVDRLRWERTLEALRSTEDGRTEQAA